MWRVWVYGLTMWLGQQSLHFVVNIPAYRLDAFMGDSLVRTVALAPGMPRYPSPRGSYTITSVEWNPWWIPPDSPWAARERPTPPGASNPMGRVKLNFRPLYFLHGTPYEHSIGTAASHGCIRMLNCDAVALAQLVLRAGGTNLSDEEIARLAEDTVHTRMIELRTPIPLEIRYDLAEVRDGRLAVYRDIYGLGTGSRIDDAYAALAAAGVDAATIDTVRLRALVRSIKQSGNSIPLDSLVTVAPR